MDNVLERIAAAVEVDKVSPDEFGSIVAAAEKMKSGTEVFLVDEFKVNKATIARWREGKSSPHPFARMTMLKKLASHLQS